MSVDILDYTFGPLLKTGQTTDRTPAGRTTKDDGGLQRGINQSKADAQYVVLTTGQYSGTVNITVNGKTDAHSNECVVDKATSIMWSRTQSAAVFGVGTEDLFWDDTGGSNEDIFEYCDQANSAGLGGYSDWRVPNYYEIPTLFIINAVGNVYPNNTAFPVWSSVDLWTSTTFSLNAAFAYTWNSDSASTPLRGKTTDRVKVILCRLGIEHQ